MFLLSGFKVSDVSFVGSDENRIERFSIVAKNEVGTVMNLTNLTKADVIKYFNVTDAEFEDLANQQEEEYDKSNDDYYEPPY
jgi:methyltransferase-like protein